MVNQLKKKEVKIVIKLLNLYLEPHILTIMLRINRVSQTQIEVMIMLNRIPWWLYTNSKSWKQVLLTHKRYNPGLKEI